MLSDDFCGQLHSTTVSLQQLMIRKVVLISICLVYLSGSFVSFIPHLVYLLNREYIAEYHCENKEKIEMHCHGKCFIGKEIIKLNQEQQATGKEQQHSVQHEIFPHEPTAHAALNYFENSFEFTYSNHTDFTKQLSQSVICPPPEILG